MKIINALLIALPTILLTFSLSQLFGEMRSQSEDAKYSCGATSEKIFTSKLFTCINGFIKQSSDAATPNNYYKKVLASLFKDEKIFQRGKRDDLSTKNKSLPDIDPTLLKGNLGEAGIKVRLNPALFYYTSTITRYVLDKEVTRVHLAEMTHQIQQVKTSVRIFNIYISGYRTPEIVAVTPSPPNQIVLSLRNFDFALSGNMDGSMGMLVLPVPFSGVAHATFYQVSLQVALAIEILSSGKLYFRLLQCNVENVGAVQVSTENGGLFGDLANWPIFNKLIIDQVKVGLPIELCRLAPGIVNGKLNTLLEEIPEIIPFTTITAATGDLFGDALPLQCYTEICQHKAPKQVVPKPRFISEHRDLHISNGVSQHMQHFAPFRFTSPPSNSANTHWLPPTQGTVVRNAQTRWLSPTIRPLRAQHHRLYRRNIRLRRIAEFDKNELLKSVTLEVSSKNTSQDDTQTLDTMKRSSDEHPKHSSKQPTPESIKTSTSKYKRLYRSILKPFTLAIRKLLALWQRSNNNNSSRTVISSRGVKTSNAEIVDPRSAFAVSHCNGCPPNAGADMFATITGLLKNAFHLKKLSHLALSLRSLRIYSTTNDQIIEINGEFSPGGNGGTPFGPFPLNFPQPIGHRMIEMLISDFTINSLLYNVHKKQMISMRIGPDIATIGKLLKTTCLNEQKGSFEDDEDRSQVSSPVGGIMKERDKRQLPPIDLVNLGLCIGSIMPSVADKYPKKNLSVHIHSARAPSILLKNAGLAIADLVLLAEFFIDGPGTHVGSITISTSIDLMLRISNNRLYANASINVLHLTDTDGRLGFSQDGFDGLASIGKKLMTNALNQQLSDGFPISLPTKKLPISLMNSQIQFIDHAIHVGTDFSINPRALDN